MIHIPQNSLRELPEDPRDFALGEVYPQINISEVPSTDFNVQEPLIIKDQGDSDFCSSYALTAVSEDQEGVELLPEYQFFKTKQISGKPDEWGADLRDACKSAVKYGSLPVEGFELFKNMPRFKIIAADTWPSNADEIARIYKKETYFDAVKGGKYDTFDNIRTALWQHKNDKCSIITGACFRPEWLNEPSGVIPESYSQTGFGHAFKIFGQKLINNQIYLVAQLSQGAHVGAQGIFYFPRSVVNKEIGKYGIFMLKDICREEAESYLNPSKPLHKNFWNYIISLFK